MRITLALLVVGGVLTTAAFVMAFTVAAVPDFGTVTVAQEADTVRELKEVTEDGYVYGRPDWGQKIFYFHVPVAEASFLVLFFTAFYGVRFLMTKRRGFDVRARIATEVTLLFVTLTMITGVLWTRAAWGVWWEWEPRLTTYFILTLMVIGYFVLRNSIEDEERRATYAAAFGILAFINAPISFFVTRLLPSTHPVIERGGLQPPMLVAFILAQIGMLMIGYAVYRLRMREEQVNDDLEQLKLALEG
ncbi:MAG: cytochrome c biogenesis protein CcsA [Coriobacteriia bacterium]|nr:cytochrome c biogenesis protein CcsA [Coriobacteriia bacterium]